MTPLFRHAAALATLALATHAAAQVTLFEREGFNGRSHRADKQINNLQRMQFNDRASSALVQGQRWEVCENERFKGRCVVLRPGQYPSLAAMGLNDKVSSARPVRGNARLDDDRYAPQPLPFYDARRRNNERLYDADVTSVRAVVGPPEQRCWVEREQVAQQPETASNIPAAIAGALIGGILGHQVGGGRGRDLATVGGAIAGGAIGTTIGRDGRPQGPGTQDVQRCTSVPSQARPALWDVRYEFRGVEHGMQMTSPPGRTVRVNRMGEPRA
jgi:uncharacterized protein YcfJ